MLSSVFEFIYYLIISDLYLHTSRQDPCQNILLTSFSNLIKYEINMDNFAETAFSRIGFPAKT